MDKFYFENQGTNTYLVYKVKPEDSLDTLSLGMITNNKINGLATTLFTQMNTTKYIKYDVSAKISVKQFFAGIVNKKRLIGVFSGIVNALTSAEDYMIDANSVVLDLNYIFADVSTCNTVLVCLPVVGVNNTINDLGAFFKNIMFNTQFDQTENCDYVARIINYLNSSPVFSLEEFKKLLNSIEKNTILTSNHSTERVNRNFENGTRTTQQVVKTTNNVQNIVQTSVSQQSVVNNAQNTYSYQDKKRQAQSQKSQNSTQDKLQQYSVPQNNTVSKNNQSSDSVNPEEKPMSMFYLLQHYNKENAAKYKAQKAAKKSQQAYGASGNQQNAVISGKDVAIPNQQNQSFAIPGQTVQTRQEQSRTPEQQYSVPQNNTYVQHQQAVSQGYQTNNTPSESSMNYGETTVLGGGSDGETVVLSNEQNPTETNVKKAFIIRLRNNERINVDKPVFRIGKERSFVDYFIGDNSYVSRGHANIMNRDGRYFIIDNNSRNHTYVNGDIITSSTEVELHSGDTFKLANEEFEFKLSNY